MKFAPWVLKNLLRNKRRTILTFLSIAVSIFVFSALVSLPIVADQILQPTASSLRIVSRSKAGGAFALPEAYQRKIASLPHILAVLPVSSFGGIYHEVTDQFSTLAVDLNLPEVYPDWKIDPQAVDAFRHDRRACLVGRLTMRRFNLRQGQQIILRGTWYPFDITLQIVGVLGGTAPGDLLVFRRDYLTQANGGSFPIAMYWARVDDLASVPAAMTEIDRTFANSDHETHTESEESFARGFLSNFRFMFTLSELLGLVVVVTIALAAANSAAMSARERQREIAILRALGFAPHVIISLVLVEAVVVALGAGVVGCVAAFIALRAVAVSMSTVGLPPSIIGMTGKVVAESVTAAILLGVISAAIPYGIAIRRDLIGALRAVG